jgi:long-chain fatty acid transport protein
MKLRRVLFAASLCVSSTAAAGGLFLPGAGAKSTARAGAAVASTDDGEAISLNPAGIAKAKGTTITLGFAAINYAMSFQRSGVYDVNDNETESYEGQAYPLIKNDPDLALGIGKYLPVPAFGIVSDLGGKLGGLSAGIGLYTTNAYPFRNMNHVNGQEYFVPDGEGYGFPAFGDAPPPTRYDVITQEALIVSPALALAYRITPDLDVGARFQAGFAEFKSTVALWGGLANFNEEIRNDGVITLDAKDNFVPGWGLGAAYRPTPNIELGAHYNAQQTINGKGTIHSTNGPGVSLNGAPVVILPVADTEARCATGGTVEAIKACVEIATPMSLTVGGRYKVLDGADKDKGDLELNVDWQNHSALRVSDFRVVADARVTTEMAPDQGINLKDSIIAHGLKDTYGVRVGGSWNFPSGANTVIARGGLGYETGAAKTNWERADIDGAARTMISAGGSYKMSRVQIDAGLGYIHQGSRTNSNTCNPELSVPRMGCGPGGAVRPIEDREGPDPQNPLVAPQAQEENPVNQGTIKSHYVMFMLGASTWF